MILPSNVPLEQLTLVTIMGEWCPQLLITRAMLTLTPADFTDSYCKELFATFKKVFDSGKQITAPTIVDAGADIHRLTEFCINADKEGFSLSECVNKLRDLRKRREFMTAAQLAIDSAANGADYIEPISRTIDNLMAIDTAESRDNSVIYDEAVAALLGEKNTVLDVGFDEFNLSYGGMGAGDLVIVAGRPSMGKSALAQQLAWNVAKQGKVSVYFSLEMSDVQILSRTIVAEAKISKRKALIEQDKARQAYREMRKYIADKDFYIADKINSLDGVYAECHRLKRQKKRLDLIVIDYLQLMQIPSGKNTTRDREIGMVTGRLKQLARELEVPIVLLSQLNRGVEARVDKRPMMSDLRESGNIEQDADMVTFLYRDAYYSHDPNDNSAEWIVAKNRNGSVGTVHLNWDGELCSFAEKEVMPWS